jgi:hypothetical protein
MSIDDKIHELLKDLEFECIATEGKRIYDFGIHKTFINKDQEIEAWYAPNERIIEFFYFPDVDDNIKAGDPWTFILVVIDLDNLSISRQMESSGYSGEITQDIITNTLRTRDFIILIKLEKFVRKLKRMINGAAS